MGLTLLTGSTGFIGSNLKELLPPMLCPTHERLDLTDKDRTRAYLEVNKPTSIIHCASNDSDDCLLDNLNMFFNLAESKIPMITFCTGLEVENRPGKSGEYVASKRAIREISMLKYNHILVIRLWGCFGKYEKPIRFFADNFMRVKKGLPILVRENRLFSYVYVKDLAKIIAGLKISSRFINVVGYTYILAEYGMIIKDITDSPHEVIIKEKLYEYPYAGKGDVDFKYTPLEEAIKEYWNDFNNNSVIQRA